MKSVIHTCLLLLFLSNSSCNYVSKDRANKDPISKLIEQYYYWGCDYPKSVDDLIDFYEESIPIRVDSLTKDSIASLLSFLKDNKKEFVFRYSHPTLLTIDYLVTYKIDTIYFYQGNYGFPGLDLLIHDYYSYYFQSPSSLQDLLSFESLKYNGNYDGLYHCLNGTVMFISSNQDQIEWCSDGNKLLITSKTDTIAYCSGYNMDFICNTDMAAERFLFRFYGIENQYVYSKEIECYFKEGIHSLSKNYPETKIDNLNIHLLIFTPEEGLQVFCSNDNLLLNTDWFIDVEKYCNVFCCEHSLGKIVFGLQQRFK